MRGQTLAMAAVVALTTLSSPATAMKGARTETSTYSAPNGVAVWVPGERVFAWDSQFAHVFYAERGERRVELSIADQLGTTAQGFVQINQSGPDGSYFCGQETFDVRPGDEIRVLVLSGTCDAGTPAVATMGVVEATFRR